jgi:hypothetical protein
MRRLMRWLTILMVVMLLAVGLRYASALVGNQNDSEIKRSAERTGHLELDLRQRPTLEALGVAPGRRDVAFDPKNPPYMPEMIETYVHLPEGRELGFVADLILAGEETGGDTHHVRLHRTYSDLESARDALLALVDMIGGPETDPMSGAFDRPAVMDWYEHRHAAGFGDPHAYAFDSQYFSGPKLGYLTVTVETLTDNDSVIIAPDLSWDAPK